MQLTLFSESTTDHPDQYYTKDVVAEKCLDRAFQVIKDIVDVGRYWFLEPSAGYGCFYEGIKKRKMPIQAFDIDPKHREIERLDFLNQNEVENRLRALKGQKIIVIGNPPFGKRSKSAIDFFNQAGRFSDLICFILPNQFKKYTTHKRLNPDFKLIDEMDLPENSFFTESDRNYHVSCVFQIWTKLKTKFPNRRITQRPEITHRDFWMYQYNNTPEALKVFDNDFDFAVFSQGYGDYKTLVTNRKDFDFKKQYILFKCRNDKVAKRLKSIDFEKLSKENTTVPGFRKNNVVAEYTKKYGR